MAPREMRPSIREDDPRAAAKRRAAEILGTGADFDADGVDDFAVPAPPDGWSYEWKRFSSMNMEDRSHQNHVKSTGWQPVPATRHPEMMEAGATDLSVDINSIGDKECRASYIRELVSYYKKNINILSFQ